VTEYSTTGPESQGSGTAKIIEEDGDTRTIEIVPVQLGPVDVEISAVYSDNAFVSQTVHLNVVPSGKGLRKFSLDRGTHYMTLVLEDAQKDHQHVLRPMVTYESVEAPIYLNDASQIKLSAEQDESNPVINVDKSGTVHALREGSAVLVGDFGGIMDRIEVIVYGKEDAPSGFRTVLR